MNRVGVGSVVGERFELLAALGGGGQARVFRARDRRLDVEVAVKVLRLGDDPQAIQRFHSEVRLARLVKHPNVCSVHEYGEDGGIVYCVMELVLGRNLREVLRERPLAWQRAYAIALEIAQGLRAIHEAGVIHRDLKSSNVMIDVQDRVRLVDFGIATPQPGRARHPDDHDLVDGRRVIGSPEYMSPEQVRGAELDARSDIYSFGVVLFELFTGRVPFGGATREEVMTRQLQDPPPLDGPLLEALPEPLVPVLRRALEKDPAQRWPDVRALIVALQDAGREPMDTDLLIPPVDARAAARARRFAPATLALAGALALALGAAAYVTRARQPKAVAPVESREPRAESRVAGSEPSPPVELPAAPTAGGARPALPRPRRPVATRAPTPAPATEPRTTTTTTTPTTTSATTTITTLPSLPASTPLVAATGAPALSESAAVAVLPRRGEWFLQGAPGVTDADCSGQPVRRSSQAESLGATGRVLVEYVVDEEGRVSNVHVLTAEDAALGRSAIDSLKRWRCRPATKNGVAGRMKRRIALDFVDRR